MFKAYFGNFKTGQLHRLPYLGYSLSLMVLLFAFVFGIIVVFAGMERAIGGNLAAAQDLIRNSLGYSYFIIVAVVISMVVAGLNITAKRARDIGLPGWIFVAGLVIVLMLVSSLISQNASQTLNLIIGLALLFIPSDTIKGHS